VSLEETSRSTHYRKTGKDPHQYTIGTWNVRTLNQGGKLENLKKEMEKNLVPVMGVSEVRWKGQGEIRSGDYIMYCSRKRNKRGQMLIDFCERAVFVITNTWFKKPKRRLYTWIAHGDHHRYQLIIYL
jgi:hypothetical protein